MKESLREYLEELNKRKVTEDLQEEIDAAKKTMQESAKDEEILAAAEKGDAAEKSDTAEAESKEKDDESTNIDDVNKNDDANKK